MGSIEAIINIATLQTAWTWRVHSIFTFPVLYAWNAPAGHSMEFSFSRSWLAATPLSYDNCHTCALRDKLPAGELYRFTAMHGVATKRGTDSTCLDFGINWSSFEIALQGGITL